jgi:hypothetical protein
LVTSCRVELLGGDRSRRSREVFERHAQLTGETVREISQVRFHRATVRMGAQWRRGRDRGFGDEPDDPSRNVLKYSAVSKASLEELRIVRRGGIGYGRGIEGEQGVSKEGRGECTEAWREYRLSIAFGDSRAPLL